MYELVLIYKSRQEERLFPTIKEAIDYMGLLAKKPRYMLLIDNNKQIIHFERR